MFFTEVFAQSASEYKLTVSAKISNQGTGQKPGFREWKDYPTRTVTTLNGYHPTNDEKQDAYGSLIGQREKATGFFYVTKVNDRWWCVDPEGYLYINKGMNDVNIGASDNNKAAFNELFKNNQDWALKTTQMLTEMGYNGAGAWSNYKVLTDLKGKAQPLPYTVMLDFMGSYGRNKGAYQQSGHLGYPDNAIFVFDPEFEKHCDQYARQISINKNDRNLFGYFSDNELPFYRKSLDNYLSKKDHADAGYQATQKWLNDHHYDQNALTDQMRNEFLGFLVDRYLSIVSKAIKKYDPNHMYIGCRFNGFEKTVKEVITAAGKYLDLLSINYYDHWTPDTGDMRNWTAWSGKPFIITEWYVKGEDSGMGNYSGAGWVVKTQQERGLFYQNFTLGLLESGNCVGWHWFKYQDNDPANKNVDPSNTDANKGILNNKYQLYNGLTDKMKELNLQIYHLIDFFDKRKKP
ncbi:MAG: agarase [Bacteroidota bacterium]